MKPAQLIPVAVLGKNRDRTGYFNYKKIIDLPRNFEELKEVFLIFKDNRVRFVDVIFSTDKIKLQDLQICEEVAHSEHVKIALSQEDMDELRVENGQLPLTRMKIVYQQEIIGDLLEIFDNNAHEILVVKLHNGKEIMIPYVDFFVKGTEGDQIFVQNIGDLLEL